MQNNCKQAKDSNWQVLWQQCLKPEQSKSAPINESSKVKSLANKLSQYSQYLESETERGEMILSPCHIKASGKHFAL